jgi:protein O-GlcNAc transferase
MGEALNHLQEAVRLDPGYADAHHHLASALRAAGRRDDAIVHYRRALQIDPSRDAVRRELADVEAERKR